MPASHLFIWCVLADFVYFYFHSSFLDPDFMSPLPVNKKSDSVNQLEAFKEFVEYIIIDMAISLLISLLIWQRAFEILRGDILRRLTQPGREPAVVLSLRGTNNTLFEMSFGRRLQPKRR